MLSTNSLRDFSLALLSTAIIVAALVYGRSILIPLALATLVTFILAPIVRWMTLHWVPQALAVAVALLGTIAFVIGLSFVFSAQMLSLTASLGVYNQNLVQKVRSVTDLGDNGVIQRAMNVVDTLGKQLEKEFKREASSDNPGKDKPVVVAQEQGPGGFLSYLGTITAPLAQAALALIFTMFLLLYHHDLRDRIVRIAGIENMSSTTAAMIDAGTKLSSLFLTQAALNVVFGVLIGIALTIIGVPNAPLWGVLAIFMRFVPFIGSYVAAFPPVLLALAIDPGWGTAIATFALFVVGEGLMGQLVEPLVLGKRAGLTPFAMIVAASFWTLIWGPIGLLLAAPITLSIVVLGRYAGPLGPLTVLLADEPPLSESETFYHRILEDDAVAAVEQLERALESRSIVEISDTIALPAMGLAASDVQRGKLDRDSATKLRETVDDVADLIIDLLPSNPAAKDPRQSVLVIPARGPSDAAAAVYIASVIDAATPCSGNAFVQATGLTALAALRGVESNTRPDIVVICTVGGVGAKQLRIIARRATRESPGTRVLVFDGGHSGAAEDALDVTSPITLYTKLTQLLAALDCGPKRAAQIAQVAE